YNGQGNSNGYGFGISNGAGSASGNKLSGLIGGVSWFDGGYTFADTTSWHLVTMVRSGGTTTLYVDGKQTATNAATPFAPTGATTIGYDDYSPGRFFNGTIDDVRVFTTALSATAD